MTRKLTEWLFENGRTEKVGPSDGCRGNAVPLAVESKYDFRELGAYLGNVGTKDLPLPRRTIAGTDV